MDPWFDAMRRGDFESAWRVCDAVLERRRRERVDCGRWPRHEQFLWDGRPLDGRDVLVHCYHGLGDTLQFVRFLPPLRARAKRTTLWVQPALLGLLDGCDGVDACIPLHDGAPPSGHDAHVESMELPHALRITLARLPRAVPYVHPRPPGERPHDDARLRVGLAWRAGDWNAARSIPERELAPLPAVPNVRWFSIQYDAAAPAFAEPLACRDLAELARRLQSLDLVVTVDTMTAHLAGALGLPTWTLLTADADWRWMAARDDSPWYPTMRLFRQTVPHDWRTVVDAVARRLRESGEEFTHLRARTA